MTLTPAVHDAMRDAATALLRAADAWRENDQAAWDASETQISRALGMSLDEAGVEILGWLEEESEDGA